MAATGREREPSRAGRPRKFDDPCRQVDVRNEQGAIVGTRWLTVSESILADLATGAPVKWACAHAGLHFGQFYEWTRRGNALLTHPPMDAATRKPRRLTAAEKRYVEWFYDSEAAAAEGNLRHFTSIASAGLRNQVTTKRTTITERTPDGEQVVRTMEVVEERPPDWRASYVIVRGRSPDFAATARHEVTGPDGQPLLPPVDPDAVAARVLDRLRQAQAAARNPDAIEASSQPTE